MKAERGLILIPVLAIAIVAVLWLSDRVPPLVLPPAGGLPESRPEGTVAAPTAHARAIRTTPHRDATRAPAPAPHRGIRGVVTSPRVVLPDGAPGVEPARWEATIYALVDRPERRTVDRIAIFARRGAVSARGEFEIDLPVGRHLVLVQHGASEDGIPVLEAWYAYADVEESDAIPWDVGRHSFGAATVRGVVREADATPCAGIAVDFSDERREPGDPLVRGVHLKTLASADGRFGFSLAREDRTVVIGSLSARSEGRPTRRDGVRHGDVVELVLDPPDPDVVFEIPWSESLRAWIYATDRRLGFRVEHGRAPPGGTIEERRRLPPGKYAVFLQRGGPGGEEWAETEVVVLDRASQRFRIDPSFRAARTVRGRAPAGFEVAWVTRVADGSAFVQESTTAGPDGRFVLRGLPTSGVLLRMNGRLTPVPAGGAVEVDVGELDSK